MITRLPLEIRLRIWELVLHQPRIVYINMRFLPHDKYNFCGTNNGDRSEFECLCSTPVPVLLHICSETRTLALKHYELAFGRANAPVMRQRSIYKPGFSIVDKEYEQFIEGNEAEIAKYAPKIYFNFEHDTVVFGQTLPSHGEEPGNRGAHFPYNNHFDMKQVQRVKNLGLTINTHSKSYPWYIFAYLNYHVETGSFQRLKNLYLCLEADDVDPSLEVKLVDLWEKVKDKEGEKIVQEFVDKWKTIFRGEQAINGVGMEGLRIIYKDGLNRQHNLKKLLLKNGASPEKVVKCAWIGNMDENEVNRAL